MVGLGSLGFWGRGVLKGWVLGPVSGLLESSGYYSGFRGLVFRVYGVLLS